MRIKIVFLVLFSLLYMSKLAQAQKTGASVSFTIKHALGATAKGSFKGFTGNVVFDPQNLSQASIKASVDARTIDTGLGIRDKTLKGEAYFDTEKYPGISMVLTRLEKGLKENEFTGYFNLTIKKTTKNVKIPFAFVQTGATYQLRSTFDINRLDYQVGDKSSLLGDVATVSITINVQP